MSEHKKKKTIAVHIFPKFENQSKIEAVRSRFDFLYGLVEPHITLIFPFETDKELNVLKEEVNLRLQGTKKFKLKMQGFEAVDCFGYYMFLKVVDGNDAIESLHYKLHEGLFSDYATCWTKEKTYKPHMTVGRFKTKCEMDKAYEELKTKEDIFELEVDRLVMERIGENEESIIEGEFLF